MPHRRRAAALGYALLGVVAMAVAAAWSTHDFPLERAIALARVSGYGATLALAGALLVTPVARMVERATGARPGSGAVATYRRALGTSAAWLSLGHATLMLTTYLDGSILTLVRPYLRAGAVATLILAALLITSFPSLTRALRVRLWKELHRFAYVAALLVLQHLVLSPFAPKGWTFAGAALFGALWATRFLPGRPRSRDDATRSPPREPDREYPETSDF